MKSRENMDEFEAMLGDNADNIMRLAYALTKDSTKAEDLFQDTMVLALRFRNNFEQGTNMRAWLSRVMKNRHISMIRRKQLEARVYQLEGRHALKAWSVGEMGRRTTQDDGGVHSNEGFCDLVDSAMSNLRPEYRQVVMLCDVDGLSYQEAAGKLTCPVGTIMSRLHRGRRALRDRLGSRERLYSAA